MTELAYIGLGSNMGDRQGYLQAGLEGLAATPGLELRACSPIYETAPVGPVQAPYLNAAAALATELEPMPLLQALLAVERSQGRERTIRWGPRTLDLDLLLYGERQVSVPGLTVPHAHLTERCFVLVPLCQLAPHLQHPASKRLLRDHLAELDCADQAERFACLTLAPPSSPPTR